MRQALRQPEDRTVSVLVQESLSAEAGHAAVSLYSTRNVGLAALIRYLYTSAVHLRTVRDERGAVFEFNDIGEDCHEIMQRYQKLDGGDGFAVADARAYGDEFFAVRQTVSAANVKGEWRNSNMEMKIE